MFTSTNKQTTTMNSINKNNPNGYNVYKNGKLYGWCLLYSDVILDLQEGIFDKVEEASRNPKKKNSRFHTM
jgi:hypothetical protein